MGGIGNEDERVIPSSISGKVLVNIGVSGYKVFGEVYAVTHISTSAEQWVEVSDNTNRLLYTEMQNAFGDEFNYKKIGNINPLGDHFGEARYSYKFSKKLRQLLDRKITDPDFDPEFVIVLVLFVTPSLPATTKLYFDGIHTLKYQVANRTLSDLPT
jgi:hypothetical protein